KHLFGRERRHRERCGRLPRSVSRLPSDQHRRGDQLVCPCTVLTQRQRMGHHLIAWCEICYLVAHGLDYSSGLDAEGHRGRRANIPLTGPNEIVPIPPTGCLPRDQTLIARRTTRLAEVKHMYRTAYSGDASSLHVDLLSIPRVTSPAYSWRVTRRNSPEDIHALPGAALRRPPKTPRNREGPLLPKPPSSPVQRT